MLQHNCGIGKQARSKTVRPDAKNQPAGGPIGCLTVWISRLTVLLCRFNSKNYNLVTWMKKQKTGLPWTLRGNKSLDESS